MQIIETFSVLNIEMHAFEIITISENINIRLEISRNIHCQFAGKATCGITISK
jgi:hypothetical protein